MNAGIHQQDHFALIIGKLAAGTFWITPPVCNSRFQ